MGGKPERDHLFPGIRLRIFHPCLSVLCRVSLQKSRLQSLGQTSGIPCGHDSAPSPVVKDISHAAGVRGDNAATKGQGFQQYGGKTFVGGMLPGRRACLSSPRRCSIFSRAARSGPSPRMHSLQGNPAWRTILKAFTSNPKFFCLLSLPTPRMIGASKKFARSGGKGASIPSSTRSLS